MNRILLPLIMFVLCSPSNAQVVRSDIKDDGTMDLNDAIHAMRGRAEGDADPAVSRVEPVTIYFNDVHVEVDFDKDVAKLTATYWDERRGTVDVSLSGVLNDEGIFYLSSDEGVRPKVIAGMRCGEAMCKTIVIDLGSELRNKWVETQYVMKVP